MRFVENKRQQLDYCCILCNYYSYGMCIVLYRTDNTYVQKSHVHLILSVHKYIVQTRTYIRWIGLEHHAKVVMEMYEQRIELFKSLPPHNN